MEVTKTAVVLCNLAVAKWEVFVSGMRWLAVAVTRSREGDNVKRKRMKKTRRKWTSNFREHRKFMDANHKENGP